MLSSLTPRLSLFFISVALKLGFTSLTGGPFVGSQSKAVWGIVVWIAWFVTLWLVALPQTDYFLAAWAQRLKRGTTVVIIILCIGLVGVFGVFAGLKADLIKPDAFPEPVAGMLAYFKSQPRYSDGAAMVQQASKNLLRGVNPYAEANIITAMEQYDGINADSGEFVNMTPVQAGRFADVFPYPTQDQIDALWQEVRANPDIIPIELESYLCYPAGSFVIGALFMAVGIDNLQFVVGIFLVLAVILAFYLVPKQGRIFIILATIVSLELWVSGLIGLEKRLLVFPFMVGGWLFLPKKAYLAMLLLGIGTATYQTVWFLVPFAAIYLYHLKGFRTALTGTAIAGAAFLVFNLPFIAADPVLWFKSIMAPMFDPLYPLGVGLVSLVQTGIIHLESSAIFSVMQTAALLGGLGWYLRNGRKYPAAGLLLSVLPVFFAWRSFGTYFYYVDFILLAVVLIEYHARRLGPFALRVGVAAPVSA
jgi:hypothetical protein